MNSKHHQTNHDVKSAKTDFGGGCNEEKFLHTFS